MAYITTEELKAELDITVDKDDAILALLCTRVSEAVDAYCHRHFEPESSHGPAASHTHKFTPLYDWENGDLLDDQTLLLRHDLCELTSITNGNGVAISLSDVVLLPPNAVPERPAYAIRIKTGASVRWTYSGSPEQSVSVAGKWTYSTEVPGNIKLATLLWAAQVYRRRTGIGTADIMVSADGTTMVNREMPADVAKLLRTYVKRS
jgi:hypothetical protein